MKITQYIRTATIFRVNLEKKDKKSSLIRSIIFSYRYLDSSFLSSWCHPVSDRTIFFLIIPMFSFFKFQFYCLSLLRLLFSIHLMRTGHFTSDRTVTTREQKLKKLHC